MLKRSYQSFMNNANGAELEKMIKAACEIYSEKGIAEIEKTPEPFMCLKKEGEGVFTGRFTALAQPDFKGTYKGGRSVVFEAKYTKTDKISKTVVHGKQLECLERHYALNAIVGVCIGIKDKFYMIPWKVWQEMKQIFGHQYLTQEDAEPYRVKLGNKTVLFFDYIHKQKGSGNNGE